MTAAQRFTNRSSCARGFDPARGPGCGLLRTRKSTRACALFPARFGVVGRGEAHRFDFVDLEGARYGGSRFPQAFAGFLALDVFDELDVLGERRFAGVVRDDGGEMGVDCLVASIGEYDFDSLVVFAFALDSRDTDAADLTDVADVRATARLQVDAGDLQ